ncbi:MAG: porin family protein [Thermoanaerobaculia bacterium]|nr:porin family protein [Thermoanaerobaculia bacterium]
MSIYKKCLATAALATTLFGAGAASAQNRSNALELGLGPSYSDRNDFSLGIVALRWSHDFNPRWGLEFAGSTDDVDDYDRSQRFIDVSARLYVFFRRRLGGVRVLGRRRRVLPRHQLFRPRRMPIFEDRGTDSTGTAHVGVAARWSINDRLYLRPELRYRDHNDVFNSADPDSLEATVAVGWRF